MKCRLCNQETKKVFTAKVIRKYDVDYFLCPNCELLQTEEPHWLEEAYASPMNLVDTGIMQRNQNYSIYVAVLLYFLFGGEDKYLDYSGGYGIFTRLMRDIGYDYFWNDKYTQNLLVRGFEYTEDMGKVRALTTFEVFEHFVQPRQEMEKLLGFSDTLIFSTQILPDPMPKPDSWYYYGFEHGQHTSIYRVKTLEYIAQEFGMKLYTNGGDFHMLTKEKLVPKIIDQSLAKNELFPKLNSDQRQLFAQSYLAPKLSMPRGGKLWDRLPEMYRQYKYDRLFRLKEEVSREERLALNEMFESVNFLMPNYFYYLLRNAPYLNNRHVLPNMNSKTFTDMLYLEQFMHRD